MPRVTMYRPDEGEKLPANNNFTVRGSVRPNNASVTLTVHVFNPDGSFSTTTYPPVTAAGGQWQVTISVGAAGSNYTLHAAINGDSDMLSTRSE